MSGQDWVDLLPPESRIELERIRANLIDRLPELARIEETKRFLDETTGDQRRFRSEPKPTTTRRPPSAATPQQHRPAPQENPRLPKRRRYNKLRGDRELREFVDSLLGKASDSEIARRSIAQFGRERGIQQTAISRYRRTKGIESAIPERRPGQPSNAWTTDPELIAFVNPRLGQIPDTQIAGRMAEKFGPERSVSYSAISKYRRERGIAKARQRLTRTALRSKASGRRRETAGDEEQQPVARPEVSATDLPRSIREAAFSEILACSVPGVAGRTSRIACLRRQANPKAPRYLPPDDRFNRLHINCVRCTHFMSDALCESLKIALAEGWTFPAERRAAGREAS